MPYDPKSNYTCLRAFHNGFCAATDEGMLHFYKQVFQTLENGLLKHVRFDLVRKWTCDSLRNYKIISMASYEVHKDSEIYLAVATKNQNIVYLNVMKQIYLGQRNELTLSTFNDNSD